MRSEGFQRGEGIGRKWASYSMLWTLEHQPDLAFVFNKKHEFSTLSIEAECRCEKRVGVTLRITVLNSVLQQFWENTSESIAHLFSDI